MSASKKSAETKVPISVRARGRVSGILDLIGDMYREAYPDRDCRWVYAPTHKPELSNVLGRKASGYVEVRVKEIPKLGDFLPGSSPDDVVRVADLVLMSIEAELRNIFKEELHQAAIEQGKRVERSYYERIDAESQEGGGRTHKASAKGSLNIEEREYEYDIEQRTSEDS